VTEQERIKADIEATRAELAETADALAAKLDVKAQASRKAHEAGEKMSERYAHVRESAPAPVQKALDKTGQAVSPLVAQAAKDKKRTLIVLAGTAVVLLVIKRVRGRREE
jgi:hypothetical protein